MLLALTSTQEFWGKFLCNFVEWAMGRGAALLTPERRNFGIQTLQIQPYYNHLFPSDKQGHSVLRMVALVTLIHVFSVAENRRQSSEQQFNVESKDTKT